MTLTLTFDLDLEKFTNSKFMTVVRILVFNKLLLCVSHPSVIANLAAYIYIYIFLYTIEIHLLSTEQIQTVWPI